jgi:hypothetical protein
MSATTRGRRLSLWNSGRSACRWSVACGNVRSGKGGGDGLESRLRGCHAVCGGDGLLLTKQADCRVYDMCSASPRADTHTHTNTHTHTHTLTHTHTHTRAHPAVSVGHEVG